MYIGIHVKYLLFLSDFNYTWVFWTDFRKIPRSQVSWKSRGSRFVPFGQTDIRTLLVNYLIQHHIL